MNFRQMVLQEGMNVFQEHGIRQISMKELLTHLDISKGTLSEIAKTKEEFLQLCIDETLSQRKAEFVSIIEESENTLEAITSLLKVHLESIAGHHPDFLPDLKTLHYDCWVRVQEFSEKYMLAYLTELFNLGIEQDIFNAGLNASMVSRILLAQTYAVADAGLLKQPENDFNAVYKLAFEYYLRGLLTEKGLSVFPFQADIETDTEAMNVA